MSQAVKRKVLIVAASIEQSVLVYFMYIHSYF